MKTKEQSKLKSEKIPKLVLSYALTTFTALAFNSIYNLTDSLFVSWGVGDNAMGGVSIVFPFVILQSAIATALGGGAGSIISREIGRGKLNKGGNIAFNAMVTFWITAVCITIAGFVLMNPFLKALGVTDELHELAKDYFTIILMGNVFSTGFSSIIRAEGKMKYALLIWVIPITINIILDAIFILLLGWGIKGSAYATVVCQFTSFSMSILFFAKFSCLDFKSVKIRFKTIKSIFAMGSPSLVQALSLSLSLLLINNVLKYSSGTMAINTFAYINKIIAFAILPFMALAQAISPIIGYNYGIGNSVRIKQTVKFSLIISLLYSLLALAVLEVIPNYLIMIFTDNQSIIELGAHATRVIALSIPFYYLAMLLGAEYQAEGRKGRALLMNSAGLIFLIPCALIFVIIFGLNGVWWSYVAGNVLATLFAGLFLLLNNHKKSTM